MRTGTFRNSWKLGHQSNGDQHRSWIESNLKADGGNYVLGDLLENGSPGGKLAPRPHQEKILKKAKPEALRIYSEDYF